jgi:kinesin family protein 1
MEGLNQTWEEKMEQTRAIHTEREKALEEMGISIDKDVSTHPVLEEDR